MQWDREFINQKAEGNCWHALKFRADPQWCCSWAVRALPGPGSILAASQSCSRALCTTTRPGQASAGARRLHWGALTCHWNLDWICTVARHKPFVLCRLADRVLIPTQESLLRQCTREGSTWKGLGWGSWTPCAETLWFVLLPSRLLSLGLCRRWAPSSPLTRGAGGRTPALLIFSEYRPTSTRDQDGGWALGGKATAQPGIQITSSTHDHPNFTSSPKISSLNTSEPRAAAQAGSCQSVWLLHPLHPPASLVVPALLSSSAEGSWAPHELQQKLRQSWTAND